MQWLAAVLLSFNSIVARELLQSCDRKFSILIYSEVFAFTSDRGSYFYTAANPVRKYDRDANFVRRAQKGLRVFPLSEFCDSRYHCHRDFSGLSIVKNIRLHFMFTSAYTTSRFMSCNVCT